MVEIVTVSTEVLCSVENCGKLAVRKGWCNAHYQRMYLYGRLDKVKAIIKGNCIVDDCNKPIKGHGYCNAHYQLWRRNKKAEKLKKEKRNHRFYIIWWQRKQDNELCEAWLDFTTFVKNISPKPEGDYLLVKLRNDKFGPDNFKWQEHLKRKENEPRKEWWARKREARKIANPSMESDRSLRRMFGLNRDQYNEKLKSQNFVCAICEKVETSVDGKTGSLRKLAVDHCHKSGKIRDLLCWRCNSTLGKLENDLKLIEKMKVYLIKHKDC